MPFLRGGHDSGEAKPICYRRRQRVGTDCAGSLGGNSQRGERLMRQGLWGKVLILIMALALVAVACERDDDDGNGGTAEDTTDAAEQEPEGGGLLQEVIDRGTLRCGVNETVPGFGFDPGDGSIDGFDIDFCRAFAAAMVGDPEAIELT